MIAQSLQMGQLFYGILANKGWTGMWIMWCSSFISFVVPLVFSPIWYKLQLETDNQFYLIRYPGWWGKFLHVFRIGYVGVLVSAFLVSFNLLAYSRIVSFYFDLSLLPALAISWFILLAYSFFNLGEQRRSINILLFLLVAIYVIILLGRLLFLFPDYNNCDLKWHDLFPSDHEGWSLFLTYMGIQWWSASMFDGGGKETARFVSNTGRRESIKSAFIPVIGQAIVSNIMILLCWLLIQNSHQVKHEEWVFIPLLMENMPFPFQLLIFIGFTAMFLSVGASQIQWGSSLVLIDGVKTYFKRLYKHQLVRGLEWGVLFFMAILSGVFAYWAHSLLELTHLVFSISAGVAPFYIARWFWWRISAFSQWMVMMTSALITLFYHDMTIRMNGIKINSLTLEENRLIFVTTVTIVVGLITTLLFPSRRPSDQFVLALGSRWDMFKMMCFAIAIGGLFLLLQLLILTFIL